VTRVLQISMLAKSKKKQETDEHHFRMFLVCVVYDVHDIPDQKQEISKNGMRLGI
jgi:hypothetical protein